MNAISFVLLAISSSAVGLLDRVRESPPWFEWVNSTSNSPGYCVCTPNLPPYVRCNQIEQVSFLARGACCFYYAQEDAIRCGWCPFVLPDHVIEKGQFRLPTNVSELNTVLCGNLIRQVKGPMCGRCTNNTGPSIYSVGSRCVQYSPVNILYYILLQYGPTTLMFLLIIIFRPNITAAPMINYVLFCNLTVCAGRFFLWNYTHTHTLLYKLALTLSAVWSFDTLLFLAPPLCISQHMEEIYIPYLEFLATIYPFVLLLLTYGLMQLHTRNFRPVVMLWGVLSRVFVRFYRAWNPRSSMIQAFASLFFLSYAKLTYLIWEAFAWSPYKSDTGLPASSKLFYTDPNVPYNSTKHIVLMVFSVAVAIFGFLPPLLILLVYPTKLYRQISSHISPKWRIRIKTYSELFHGSFKDGTNGTRDYRFLSVLVLLFFGFVPQLLPLLITVVLQDKYDASLYITAITFSTVAFLCTLLQPYKARLANAFTTGLLVTLSLLIAIAAAVYDETKSVEIRIFFLSVVPHCVLWGYIVWRMVKILGSYCCKNQRLRCDGERESLLLPK